jgi:hypothetical protein
MVYKTPSKIFDSSTGARSLATIYRTHVQRGVARGRDGVAPIALSEDIVDICRKLAFNLRHGEHGFTQYRELLVSKGAGRNPRVVSVPSARDRIVLRALAEFLAQVYPAARGVIPQVRVEEVRAHLSHRIFDTYIRLDVKNFYPSIRHDIVRQRLSKRIRRQEILDVITLALETPTVPDRARRRSLQKTGVPQGLAISNLIAELVAEPIDSVMHIDPRCVYVRFVDDVLILCQKADAGELYKKACALFSEQGLKVHSKTRRDSKSSIGKIGAGFDYLGYVFADESVSVRPVSIHKLEASLARSFTRYAKSKSEDDTDFPLNKCEWHVNLAITGCTYKGISRGWLQYFRQMNDLKLLKKLDATVRRFEKRFGVPPRFQVKSFMRAYWAIRYPQGRHFGYVPNFDEFPVHEMRSTLITVFGQASVSRLSDDQIVRRFHGLIDKAVTELDNDIAANS